MFGPIKRTVRNNYTGYKTKILYGSGSWIWHLITQKKVEFQQTRWF